MLKIKKNSIALIALPLALALSACDDSSNPVNGIGDGPQNIIETARDAGSFTTLLTALDVAGLTRALEADGPYTVFAPTDEAFAAIDAEVLSDLLADIDLLTAVLTYHVIPGEVPASSVARLASAETLNEKSLSISLQDGAVFIDGAQVTVTDIQATNGIIHVIDAVVTPQPIADIVQTARGAETFETLLAAVEAAGLTEVLKGDGPLTVFAPTDEAFAAIPAEALNALLADREALISVLTYHVVPERYLASDVLAVSALGTANGASAAISLDGDGNPRIDDALITAVDIETKNGVIHVIDRVIFPG
jgi:uncharacterized surface protein with fasciclin (FAS1) repeats